MKRRSITYSLFFCLVSLSVLSCADNKTYNEKNIIMPRGDFEIHLLSYKWKKDSCGCENVRTYKMVKTIVEQKGLVGKNKEELLSYLGKPNEVLHGDNHEYLLYYITCYCDRNKRVINNSDKTWIEFDFLNNSLVEMPDCINVE